MRQVPLHRVVNSACSRVGRATQTAGTFLSILCLFFISVFIASIPASLEERTGYFFLFGLIPALGFYLIGYILRGMLALSCKLCGIIAPHCLRWQARFTDRLLNWASAFVLDLLDGCSMTLAHCRLAIGQWMQIFYRLAQKERRSVNRQYRYVRGAIIEFSCLLIRNAARFVITLQQSVDRSPERASCLSFDDMTLLISNNKQCKQPPGGGRTSRRRSIDGSTGRNGQGLFRAIFVGSIPICRHHTILSPERCGARPAQRGTVSSSLILSAEDTASGEAKVGKRLRAGGRRSETAAPDESNMILPTRELSQGTRSRQKPAPQLPCADRAAKTIAPIR